MQHLINLHRDNLASLNLNECNNEKEALCYNNDILKIFFQFFHRKHDNYILSNIKLLLLNKTVSQLEHPQLN